MGFSKVLRFYAIWDDTDSMFGECRKYIIHYYLMDDTVDIREVHERNDGRDPFPLMMNRQRMPKVLVENASRFDLVYLLIIGTFFRSQGSYLISVVIPRYTSQALAMFS